MRRVTRNVAIGTLVVVVLLLALGALPGLLRSGAPYYVTATPIADTPAAVNGSQLPSQRYPYTTTALSRAGPETTGRSDAYYEGPFGLKEGFTHSPFDELAALRQRHPGTTDGEAVRIAIESGVYRVTILREGSDE